MEKEPIKPSFPKYEDFPKVDYLPTPLRKSPFIIACEKYYKDLEQYNKNYIIWRQLKFIKDIKRSSEKLILKKYFITKN